MKDRRKVTVYNIITTKTLAFPTQNLVQSAYQSLVLLPQFLSTSNSSQYCTHTPQGICIEGKRQEVTIGLLRRIDRTHPSPTHRSMSLESSTSVMSSSIIAMLKNVLSDAVEDETRPSFLQRRKSEQDEPRRQDRQGRARVGSQPQNCVCKQSLME